jgi:hypothetical protein
MRSDIHAFMPTPQRLWLLGSVLPLIPIERSGVRSGWGILAMGNPGVMYVGRINIDIVSTPLARSNLCTKNIDNISG